MSPLRPRSRASPYRTYPPRERGTAALETTAGLEGKAKRSPIFEFPHCVVKSLRSIERRFFISSGSHPTGEREPRTSSVPDRQDRTDKQVTNVKVDSSELLSTSVSSPCDDTYRVHLITKRPRNCRHRDPVLLSNMRSGRKKVSRCPAIGTFPWSLGKAVPCT